MVIRICAYCPPVHRNPGMCHIYHPYTYMIPRLPHAILAAPYSHTRERKIGMEQPKIRMSTLSRLRRQYYKAKPEETPEQIKVFIAAARQDARKLIVELKTHTTVIITCKPFTIVQKEWNRMCELYELDNVSMADSSAEMIKYAVGIRRDILKLLDEIEIQNCKIRMSIPDVSGIKYKMPR